MHNFGDHWFYFRPRQPHEEENAARTEFPLCVGDLLNLQHGFELHDQARSPIAAD